MNLSSDPDWKLLEQLCQVQAPSGNEAALKAFILAYVEQNQASWQHQPKIIQGDAFQDCLMLVFGQPRTAVFAHMDSIGFTVRYQDQLVPIGSPKAESGSKLVGEDRLGPILCELIMEQADENSPKQAKYKFGRGIERGTELVYECHFQQSDDYIHSCYLDNRLGVLNALKLAETLENGILVFSCWEEHGGGSVPYLANFIIEEYRVSQCLISDVTWVTDGILHGDGAVISLRDRNIPRRTFVNQIVALAEKSNVPYQLEVEGGGSSDGRELQISPYPFDWCFIGTPVTDAHTPQEKVYWPDAVHMFALYQYLMKTL
ncbi:MAG: aminopeptidase [Tunicatimonas sp.]|uniref:aminopeptidase n=1 Tax=Tunicatimonas sp. TaxID=1940096 RepID=UPI003C78C866